ncbi:MAG: bifunctional diaminohydroxyphosphoribosylaminopyrimidine deaminase/5-amino-6-(5-phosphoribosylamino)uracil reductase RibD [Vicinamibacterales bacterium]
MPQLTDADWMARALLLAERGRGTTTPNPLVGAVVVAPDGVVVGQGAHLKAGGPHAEVFALDAAGDHARGATLYCTLEPCCHVGRTGPCVERIAAAGIRRVVTAMPDPNPRVNGSGHKWLRLQGIDVETGVRQDEAIRQNKPFLTWVQKGRPWTLLKTVTSADGFVGRRGDRTQLSGVQTDRWMQRQRAWIDALVVGAGTTIVDDPLLTARGAMRARPLTRVVVDWRGRIPLTARVWSTLSAGPVIMVVLEATVRADPERFAVLRSHGVVLEVFATRDLKAVAERLAERDVQSLLLEGGPSLQQAWLEAGLVDHVQWVIAPVLLGDGVPMVPSVRTRGEAVERMALGDDELVEFEWQESVTDVHRFD